MKTKNLFFGISLICILFLITSCTNNEDAILPQDKNLNESLKKGQVSLTSSLTNYEIEGILFMREEEKLARDIYLVFNSIFPHQTFDNISKSEQKHTDTMAKLIDYYSLEDPFIDTIGKFVDPTLCELYQVLIDWGTCCLDSALVVGAIIEETDIEDIERFANQTEVKNITNVYQNLLDGSENHLRAFVNALDIRGIDYYPRLLTIEKFTEIMNE